MPTFEPGDVVKVPVPYTDRATRQYRPALVVSNGKMTSQHRLIWVIMITSAKNKGWAGDVTIRNLSQAGLPAPSIVRAVKIATIDADDAEGLGAVASSVMRRVLASVGAEIG